MLEEVEAGLCSQVLETQLHSGPRFISFPLHSLIKFEVRKVDSNYLIFICVVMLFIFLRHLKPNLIPSKFYSQVPKIDGHRLQFWKYIKKDECDKSHISQRNWHLDSVLSTNYYRAPLFIFPLIYLNYILGYW